MTAHPWRIGSWKHIPEGYIRITKTNKTTVWWEYEYFTPAEVKKKYEEGE